MKQTAGPHRLTNRYLNKIKFNLILLGPHVSFDYADVAVDPTPPVCDSRQHLVTDQWVLQLKFDLAGPVDLLMSL